MTRQATAALATLVAVGLALHQAGRIDALRVRETLAIVELHRDRAYTSPVGLEWPEYTFTVQPQLFEDGRPLGPSDSRMREIRRLGGGRYLFSGSRLFFSSSDGTDPRLNRRSYYFEGPRPLARQTAVLCYAALGLTCLSALAPWLLAGLLGTRTRLMKLVATARAAAERAAAQREAGGFVALDVTPVSHSEALFAAALAAAVLLVVVWFLASPALSSTMLEYALKAIPLYLDGSFAAILDVNAAGDPRGRIVNSFFTWVNVLARKQLLLRAAIHPALSVNWLLYPLTLAFLYRALSRVSGGHRFAAVTTLLYAASPGMLDTLVDYHLPGKPLVNLCFAASFYGVALIMPVAARARPAMGFVLLGSATFLGMLSDETAVFIPLSIGLLFGERLLSNARPARTVLLIAASFLLAFAGYLVVVLMAVPLANALLEQAPLDLPTSVLRGPYAAMFGAAPRGIGTALVYYDPVGLLQTIISAHLIPGRVVGTSWTSGVPYPPFWRWSLSEQYALYLVSVVVIALLSMLAARPRHTIWRIVAAFAVYAAGQSLLLTALSGYIWESSYYAAQGSLFVALLLGAIVSASAADRRARALAWLLVAYVMAVEVSNMVSTAQRHPYIGESGLTHADLEAVWSRIKRGDGTAALGEQPFPSRRFIYAFEVAAAFESASGRPIDFQPLAEPQPGLVRHVDVDRVADPNVALDQSWAPGRGAQFGEATVRMPIEPGFFHAGVIRGQSGVWGYEWRFDGSGQVIQRAWRRGLMRVWSARGRVEPRRDGVCLVFATAPSTCFASLRQEGDWIIGLAADGKPLTHFRWAS